MPANPIKKQLFEACKNYVENRLKTIRDAMADAQSSANSETKSTAGDKHDTSRAMMQLAAEQNGKHLAEAEKLEQTLHLLDTENTYKTVKFGSLVQASNGNFYIAISAGKIELDGIVYFAISPGSPIGQALNGLKEGDSATFNGNKIIIQHME